jgi:type I restriction enzyme S subunit
VRGDWTSKPIRELYEGLYDGPHATPKPASAGPVFLGIKNITEDGKLDLTNIRHIAEEDFEAWTRRVVPQAGDIVFVYEATLNRYAIIPPGFRGCLGRRLALVRPDRSKVDGRFLFYYFFTDEWRRVIAENTLLGATVDRIPLTNFPMFTVRVPPLSEQRRIANVLAAYDELIENNLHRIRVLEDMTRVLYREWFMASRSVDSIRSDVERVPRGWSRTDLATVCASKNGIQTGPFGSQLHQHEYADEGVPVVMPKDLVGFRINTEGIARVPTSVAERLPRHKVEPGDIVYGRRGDIGRRAFVMQYQAGWLCGTGCLRLRPDASRVNKWFLFNYLGEADVVQLIAGRAHGVTLPNLNAGLMASVPVLLPPRSLQDRFEATTFSMAELIEALLNQNAVLRQTRDLLVPRLLSGQLRLTEVQDGLAATTTASQALVF